MRRGPFILIATGALAIVLGGAGLLFSHQTPPLVSLATSRAAGTPTVGRAASEMPTAAPAAVVTTQSRAAVTTAGPPAAAPLARISIPRIGIHAAPVYDRGTDSKGNMLIASGYAVTHYAFSAPFGAGNAVIYGHDDIQGNIFGHLYDLGPGDVIQIDVAGQTQTYRVTGHQIVPPTAVSVLNPTADDRLTIITCWPFNVDTKRWIVTAVKA